MKTVICALLTAFIMGCISYASSAKLSRNYVIVNMDSAPIEILEFGRYIQEDEDHISSVVRYINRTKKSIEAVAIAIIYYDPFDEKEDGVRGISTDILGPQVETSVGWSIYGEPELVKTATAYVSAVRFRDGEIWKADTKEVIKEAGKLPKLEFLSETTMLEIEKKQEQ